MIRFTNAGGARAVEIFRDYPNKKYVIVSRVSTDHVTEDQPRIDVERPNKNALPSLEEVLRVVQEQFDRITSGFSHRLSIIYMYLQDEGVDCWRPVIVEVLSENRFRIVTEQPDDEVWEFPPGSVVETVDMPLSESGDYKPTPLASRLVNV